MATITEAGGEGKAGGGGHRANCAQATAWVQSRIFGFVGGFGVFVWVFGCWPFSSRGWPGVVLRTSNSGFTLRRRMAEVKVFSEASSTALFTLCDFKHNAERMTRALLAVTVGVVRLR